MSLKISCTTSGHVLDALLASITYVATLVKLNQHGFSLLFVLSKQHQQCPVQFKHGLIGRHIIKNTVK